LTGAAGAAGASRRFSRASRRAAATLALGATLFAVASLHRYGVTIDEPALLYAGDRTLFALAHPGRPAALDFEAGEPAGFASRFPRLPVRQDPEHYPVLPALVAAAGDATVGRALGLGPVDGHHAGLAILSITLLFLYTLYACRLLGDAAGIAAAIALACFPTIVGHAFNDPKDWPCAGFYALTVLAAGVGLTEKSPRHLWIAGVFLGLAMSCKQNGALAAVTVALAAPFSYRLLYASGPIDHQLGRRLLRRLMAPFVLLPFIGCAIFVLAWPWLWWGGPAAAVQRFGAFVDFARGMAASDRATFSLHPFRCLLFMTPPVLLVAAAIGCRPGRDATPTRRAIGALLAIWVLLPLVRIALPHANFYDANRHFLEYVPALCALAGLGFAEGWRRAAPIVLAHAGPAGAGRTRARLVGAVALAAGAAALAWPVAQYHPFETAYFNFLVGGLGGAQRSGLFRSSSPTDSVNGTEGDYWSSALREGIRDARAVAAPGERIGVCAWLPALAAIDDDRALPITTAALERAEVGIVLASPRELRCSWKRLHELERWRPLLTRVTRGGGLVYEVLGPRADAPHAPVSPPTAYDP
jgi:hypothetical protein